MADDEELRRRLMILKDALEEDKIKFAPHLIEGTKKSLSAVKYGPDGQIDLSTVDARVRALALGITAMKDREDMKSAVSLREIEQTYFQWLDNNFGEFYRHMVEQKADPDDAGHTISNDPEAVEYTVSIIPEFMEVLTDYWSNLADPAYAHLEDLPRLKAVFGGDFFPSAQKNIASSCGLYTDTIILPEPFLQSNLLFDLWPKEQQTYYFIKHALNVLQYKNLALAEVEPPIVAVLPGRVMINKDEARFITGLGRADALKHASLMFGQEFETYDELLEFLVPLETSEQAVKAIADPDRLLFDTTWTEAAEEQLKKYISEVGKDLTGFSHAGKLLMMQAEGRMSQANDLLMKCRELNGSPLIDAPTSWQYLIWKNQYDSQLIEHRDPVHLHVLRGLQSAASGEMQWIGNIPPEALIEMRKQGAETEIRDMLSEGIVEITKTTPEDFHATSRKIVDNINNAFEKHQQRNNDLRSKQWKFAGTDIASCLVHGTIEIAAACGVPLVSLINSALDQSIDVPKLKDLPGRFQKLREESNQVKNSPVGLLFNYKK